MESDQPVLVSDQLESQKIWRIAIFLIFNLLPYSWAILTLIVAPGFVIPFFNHPVARVILLTPMLLQLIVVILFVRRELLRKDSTAKQIDWPCWLSAAMLGSIIFTAPMLGPALITIVNAVVPMYK